MERFTKLFALILILMECNYLNINALTGTSSSNGPLVSVQFAVRNILSDDNIPVVNATPSRVTLIQFPAEIAQCNGASRFIKIKYADASATTGSIQSGSTTTNKDSTTTTQQTDSTSSGSPVSAVFISVELQDGGQGSQGAVSISFDELRETPPTWFLCRMKREKSDTFCTAYNNSEPYCWVSFAVRIVDPEYTNGIVILEKPNGTNDLISPEQLQGIPFVNTFVDKRTNRINEGNKDKGDLQNMRKKPSSFHPQPKKNVPTIIVDKLDSSKKMLSKQNIIESKVNDLNVKEVKKSNEKSQIELITSLPLVKNNTQERKETKKLSKNDTKSELVDPLLLSEIIEK